MVTITVSINPKKVDRFGDEFSPKQLEIKAYASVLRSFRFTEWVRTRDRRSLCTRVNQIIPADVHTRSCTTGIRFSFL